MLLPCYSLPMDTVTHPIYEHFRNAQVLMENESLEVRRTKNPETDLVDAEQAINALVLHHGNVHRAAGALGMRRAKLKHWLELTPEAQSCMNDLLEANLDEVEAVQMAAAMGGDMGAGRFILQTKGKDRGYVTRNETTGKDGADLVPPTVDFAKMSTEALQELKAAVKVDQ